MLKKYSILSVLKNHKKKVVFLVMSIAAIVTFGNNLLGLVQNLTSILQPREIDGSNRFRGSIFDEAEKIYAESLTLRKKEMAQKYNGSKVKATGYLFNSDKEGNNYIAIIGAPTSTKSTLATIKCIFLEKWSADIESLNKYQQVSFEGIIDFQNDSEGISLSGCRLN